METVVPGGFAGIRQRTLVAGAHALAPVFQDSVQVKGGAGPIQALLSDNNPQGRGGYGCVGWYLGDIELEEGPGWMPSCDCSRLNFDSGPEIVVAEALRYGGIRGGKEIGGKVCSDRGNGNGKSSQHGDA